MKPSWILAAVLFAYTSALGVPCNTVDQLPLSNENGFQWMNATTKNGKPYRIGYPIGISGTEHSIERESTLAVDKLEFIWYNVLWPTNDSEWKTVEIVPQLTKYALYEQGRPRIYKYALYVYLTNTGFGTTYTFEDNEGNEYPLTAFTDGSHAVDFDFDYPEEPSIRRVKTDQNYDPES